MNEKGGERNSLEGKEKFKKKEIVQREIILFNCLVVFTPSLYAINPTIQLGSTFFERLKIGSHLSHPTCMIILTFHSVLQLYVLKHGSVGELVVKLKRQTQSRRNRTGKRGIMSEVPDNVLLYIMSFMSTRDAVLTSVLSNRGKDLSKRLTDITLL